MYPQFLYMCKDSVAYIPRGRQAGIGLRWYPKSVFLVTATARLFDVLFAFCLITFKYNIIFQHPVALIYLLSAYPIYILTIMQHNNLF
jgi:hypothetical protein